MRAGCITELDIKMESTVQKVGKPSSILKEKSKFFHLMALQNQRYPFSLPYPDSKNTDLTSYVPIGPRKVLIKEKHPIGFIF